MNAFVIAIIVFLVTLGGAALGAFLRMRLPKHHVSEESRYIVKVSTGLVATLVALLLGLLVSSANDAFQAFSGGLEKLATRLITFDRQMANYGPETQAARRLLRRHTLETVAQSWPEDRDRLAKVASPAELAALSGVPAADVFQTASLQTLLATNGILAEIEAQLLDLAPQNVTQGWRQSEALSHLGRISEEQWLLVEKALDSMPRPLVVLLVAWLAILFATFGLFAPRNTTVATVLVLCAMSAAAAVFLILEMNSVTSGLMKVSSEPLIKALQVLGR